MVKEYCLSNPSLLLSCDLAAEFPLYVYLGDDKQTLLYADSITELLDDARVQKPLKISHKGISFLLQSGVVPLPYSIYKNIFILGIGNSAKISTQEERIVIDFSYKFPFENAKRFHADEMALDSEEILQLIAEATISRIDTNKPTFLFQSAGKDSNMIALALARAGYQDKVTFVSHKSKGDKDESEIAQSIANKLGFKHKILHEADDFNSKHLNAIDEYFTNAPFPCMDSVTLAYPLYVAQMPELKGANIIDGMGNDVYIGHIPSKKEYRNQKLSKILKYGRFLTQYARSEFPLHIAGKTRSEWTGLNGFSFSDTDKIFKKAFNVADFWSQKDNDMRHSDYFDFRATIRGGMIDGEMFCRKVRNFADVIGANMIFPYANEKVATYFASMPEEYLFDRKLLKNKLIFRKILKEELDLDSDKLGKMIFVYDSRSVVLQNWAIITQEIYECKFWDADGIRLVIERMKTSMEQQNWEAGAAGRLIYGIYLLSAWLNKNRWLERI